MTSFPDLLALLKHLQLNQLPVNLVEINAFTPQPEEQAFLKTKIFHERAYSRKKQILQKRRN